MFYSEGLNWNELVEKFSTSEEMRRLEDEIVASYTEEDEDE